MKEDRNFEKRRSSEIEIPSHYRSTKLPTLLALPPPPSSPFSQTPNPSTSGSYRSNESGYPLLNLFILYSSEVLDSNCIRGNEVVDRNGSPADEEEWEFLDSGETREGR